MKVFEAVICYQAVTVFQVISGYPDDAVNFPGLNSPRPTSFNSPKPSISITISPCSNNQQFCESTSDYPNNVGVDSNLLQNPLIKAKIFDGQKKTRGDILNTRFGVINQDKVRACKAIRREIFPKKARNVKGEYVFIVNHGQYRQSVEIEQCENEGESCLTDNDAPYSGFTTCRQKYATYKLYAISATREQIYDSFSLPSACICHYKSPSTLRDLRVRSQPSTPPSFLPRCQAGTKLDLPKFVNSFSDNNDDGRHQSSSIKRQDLNPEALVYPDDNIRRIPRRSRSRKQNIYHRDYYRWTRDASDEDSDDSSEESNESSEEDTQRHKKKRRRRPKRSRENIRPSSRPTFRPPSRPTSRPLSRPPASVSSVSSRGCGGPSNYCVSLGNYPVSLTRNLLSQNPAVGVNLFKQVFDAKCSQRTDIGTRFFGVQEEQLCVGRQNVIFPQKALNLNNEWKFVVNVDNFTQAVEIEECENQGFSSFDSPEDTFGSCQYGGSLGNNPRETSCRQIYTEYKLLSLSSSETSLEVDTFMLPSACACYTAQNSNTQIFEF